MDFNSVLNKIGDFGYYQKLLLGLFLLPSSLFFALAYYTQFFILLEPPHRCASNNLSLPYPEGADLSCREYIPIFNSTDHISWDSIPCTSGWEYDYSLYFPTIISEKNWVCDDNKIPYHLQSFFYLGMLIGAYIFGHISDTYGRKPSILIGSASCLIAGCLSAVIDDYYFFIFLRMVVGGSSMPLLEDCYILSLEYIGKKYRTYPLIVLAIGYSIFPAAYPFLPKLVRNWRMICIISSLPLSFYLIFYKYVPESACWLLTQGKTEEAIKYLQTVARLNGNDIPPEMAIVATKEGEQKEEENSDKLSLLSLFKTPRIRRNTIMLCFVWFMTVSCYNAMIQNSSNLGTDVYYSFMYGGLIELPSVLWMFLAVDKIGRRWTMVISSTIGGIGGLFSLYFKNDTNIALLVIALIERVALTSQYSVMAQYTAELYPTVIRSRSVAFLNLIGTSGLVFSPYIVFLALSWPYLPLLISGVLCIIIAMLTFFLPETLNHHLPHTMDEGENFGKGQKLFNMPCLNSNCGGEKELKNRKTEQSKI